MKFYLESIPLPDYDDGDGDNDDGDYGDYDEVDGGSGSGSGDGVGDTWTKACSRTRLDSAKLSSDGVTWS